MAMTEKRKRMMEHVKKYRMYQQKVKERDRLTTQIEQQTGRTWVELRSAADLSEQYGTFIAMLATRLRKLEPAATEAEYWLGVIEAARVTLPEHYVSIVNLILQGMYLYRVADELGIGQRTVVRAQQLLLQAMVELSVE